MTHSKLILMVGILLMVFSVSVEVEAKRKPKDVNVVNTPLPVVVQNLFCPLPLPETSYQNPFSIKEAVVTILPVLLTQEHILASNR